MNIIKIYPVLTAALLTGALSATAFAAETLTTTTGSITFRKAIDVTNAEGAGGITGTIAFDVTAADESDLPDDGEKNYVGSVDQLDGSDITATFAADDSGISFKDYVVQLAEENIRQIHSIKKFSAENDVTLTEDNLKAIEEQRKTDMVNLCGEEVSDEEFAEFLKSTYYLPIKVYDDMNEIN